MPKDSSDAEPIDALMMEAAWRYQLIAPLTKEGDPDHKASYRKDILSKRVHHPWQGEVSLKPRTLRRWCQRYRESGLKGLLRNRRRDRGLLRALPPEALERALELRVEDGRRSVPQLLKLLSQENPEWKLTRSTLDRHLRARGSARRRRGPEGPFGSFEANQPLELLQGDILHGPVALFDGKPRRSKLVGWLDDHSRFLCHLQAYPDERLPAIEDSLKRVILKFGLPERVFVDNAWVYSGRAFSLACSELGIAKIHSTPRYPVSRGKIERVFRTLREQLLQEVENVETLSARDLNRYLAAWVDSYHEQVHSQTKQSPNQRFENRLFRPVLSAEQLEQAFWQWTTRSVSSHGEIKFEGNLYRVDPSFSGQKVVVRYDPYDLSSVYLWKEGRRLTTATSERLKRRKRQGRSTPKRERNSTAAQRYLENLVNAHDERLSRELNLTSYPEQSKTKEQP